MQEHKCICIKPVNKIIAQFHMLSSIVFIQYTLCWWRFLVLEPIELIRMADKGDLTMDHSGSHGVLSCFVDIGGNGDYHWLHIVFIIHLSVLYYINKKGSSWSWSYGSWIFLYLQISVVWVVHFCHNYTRMGKIGLGLWCLMPLSSIFQLYSGGQFYWWRKPESWISIALWSQFVLQLVPKWFG
jgi:hypothetical protein